MSRHNLTFLIGAVLADPAIHRNDEGTPVYATCSLYVVRSVRDAGDRKNFMKPDDPLIMTRTPETMHEMEKWKKNDIVYIKGVVAAKNIMKSSYCTYCGEKNIAEGTVVYVNPIFAARLAEMRSEEEAQQYLAGMREVSNQAYMIGTLCRDPVHVVPKEGLGLVQYQIALNRKYFIRTDPPEIRTDYPWVKSYGENASMDLAHLHTGSKIFIDGCLQARNVQRHMRCSACGETYDWKERVMEIVPYETEYLADFYTEEDLESMKRSVVSTDSEDGGYDDDDIC